MLPFSTPFWYSFFKCSSEKKNKALLFVLALFAFWPYNARNTKNTQKYQENNKKYLQENNKNTRRIIKNTYRIQKIPQ